MNKAQSLKIARQSLLLRTLPEQVMDAVLADATTRNFAKGETVFLHGEPADVIHVVLEGWVKLYRIAANGNEAVVSVFTRSQSFGEAVAFRMQPYPVSAEAVTDCTLLEIPVRRFISLLRREPEMATAIIASTFQHLHDLIEQVEQIKARTGPQRVAEFLIGLCDCASGPCMVTLPYDKALIAGGLGMKPESLSRAFARLKPVGVLVSRNHASIEDIAALREFAERDTAEGWEKPHGRRHCD